MREHKYRAFDKEIEGGHMVYSDGRDKVDRQVEYDFLIDEKGNLVCAWFEDYDDSCWFSRTNNGTLDNLMQFTGICDKNGKEIYDGDVLFDPSWWWGPRFVYLNVGKCGPCKGDSVMSYLLAKDIKNPLDSATHNIWNGKDVEIIGNIYENPELLEGART